MLKLIRSHPILFVIIVLIFQSIYFLSVSNRPYTIAPEGRTYNVLGKNFYYPSMIRQAKDGSWGIKDTHTTRETPIVYAQLFFVVAGKIASLFSIDPVDMYQLLRLTGVISSAFCLYFLAKQLFPSRWATVATILAVGLETSPSFSSLKNGLFQLVPAWDVHILFERRFSLPHHTWGDAFGFLFFGFILYCLFNPSTKKKPWILQSVLLFLLGFWATTVLPSFIVPYFAMSGIAFLFLLIKKKTHWKYYTLILVSAFIGIILAALLLKVEFSKGSPWTEWTAEEKSWMQHSVVINQYVNSLLLYVPFIITAIGASIIRYKQMSTKLWTSFILSLSWLLFPIGLISISHLSWFPFANFRLVDLHGYAPAGILSTIGIWHLLSIFPSTVRKSVGFILTITLILISTFFTWQYTKQIYTAQENFWINIYPTKETWQGVLFMKNLPQQSNVMVKEYFGEMLPAFGPVSVYIGGGHGFTDWLERRWIAEHFYKAQLSDKDARELLQKEHITHVFWGPDEKSFSNTTTLYPTILESIFTNSDVTVYKVKQQ